MLRQKYKHCEVFIVVLDGFIGHGQVAVERAGHWHNIDVFSEGLSEDFLFNIAKSFIDGRYTPPLEYVTGGLQ